MEHPGENSELFACNLFKIKLLLVYFFIFFTFISCESPTEPPIDNKDDSLLPLKMNNYWVYEHQFLKEDGTINYIVDTSGYKITDTLTIIHEGNRITSYKYARFHYPSNTTSDHGWLYYSTDKGIYGAGGLSSTDTLIVSDQLFLKYPVNKGDSWKFPQIIYQLSLKYWYTSDSLLTYDCVATDSLFKTPLGDFRCIVYHTKAKAAEDAGFENYYYFYKPNVGMVGFTLVQQDLQKPNFQSVIQSYKLY